MSTTTLIAIIVVVTGMLAWQIVRQWFKYRAYVKNREIEAKALTLARAKEIADSVAQPSTNNHGQYGLSCLIVYGLMLLHYHYTNKHNHY